MIPFNMPVVTGDEREYLNKVFINKKFSGKGPFTNVSQKKLLEIINSPESRALLTTSCTDALEMAAILADIKDGDEVIMPSFTFVSSANAFVLRGARIQFVDIDPLSMNIDPEAILKAITPKTKVVLVVHYAGMSCDMEKVSRICKEHHLIFIEDAAQALASSYQDKHLGTFGDLSCFSFHDTKNYHCGEGGALIINNPKYFDRAEIIIEKGTDRNRFLNGQVDKYTWQDIGSSFILSEINAAFLCAQLNHLDKINNRRKAIWDRYYRGLSPLKNSGVLSIVEPLAGCIHNAHLFGLVLSSKEIRSRLIEYMKSNDVQVAPHYIPLHSSPAGIKFGNFSGVDRFTTDLSERLIRLPLFFDLKESEVDEVIRLIIKFCNCSERTDDEKV